MVTPSLVMIGGPNDLLSTTLRPFGPSVTLTVLASLSTPRSSARRASSSKLRIFAMGFLPCHSAAPHARQAGAPRLLLSDLLLDDRQYVAGREHQVLLA